MKMMMTSCLLRSLSIFILVNYCSIICAYKHKANGLNFRNMPLSYIPSIEKLALKAHAAPFDSPESLRDMVDR